MPKTVLPSKFVELEGLDRISTTVHAMKCIWREIGKDDLGIDGEIEVLIPKPEGTGFTANGSVIKVQAKSGTSYVVNNGTTHFESPVKKEDMETWFASRYPVLYIVYHPADKCLYAREVHEYVKAEPRAFMAPFRIRFDKATHRFDAQSGETVRAAAGASPPKVNFQSREEIWSNLLPVRRLPMVSHATCRFLSRHDLLRNKKQGSAWLPPFDVRPDGRLYTFGDLRGPDSPFNGLVDTDAETMSGDEWGSLADDYIGPYMFLMNQCLGDRSRRCKLDYNRTFDRTYFPRDNDTNTSFSRDWLSVRTHRKDTRTVVDFFEYGSHRFWRHHGAQLSWLRFGGQWMLRIIPKYFFTTDGFTPWDPELVGPYTTRIRAMEHNPQVLNHVLFWADTLALGTDSIKLEYSKRSRLVVDRKPLSAIAKFGIPDDPATVDEASVLAPSLFGNIEEDEDD